MAQSAAAHKKHGSHIHLSVGDRLFVILNYTLLALVMLIVLYPLVYIVSCSFSSPAAVTGGAVWLFPVDFSLVGYETVFKNSEIIPSFWNAVLITVVGTIINVACPQPRSCTARFQGPDGKRKWRLYRTPTC